MAVRIISAAVAIVLAVGILFLHNTVVLDIAVALIAAGMLLELYYAVNGKKYRPFLWLGMLYVLAYFAQPYLHLDYNPLYFYVLLMFAVYLKFYSVMHFRDLFFMLAVTLLIPPAMNTILVMDNTGKHGLFLLILALCGAWLADSGAYFAGTFFGKHKLCPLISPKKTVEGLVGGIVTNAVLFAVIALAYNKIFAESKLDFNWPGLILSGMLCALIGLVGDLSASVVKRKCGIKDYGNIMPGHGGFMDRFDSVLFVAPFMAYVYRLGFLF